MIRDLMLAIASGAGLALAFSAHCVLMCGPLAMLSHARGGRSASLRYLSGRLVSYGLLGALAGSVGQVLSSMTSSRWVEAALSWSLALVLALAALKLLRRARTDELVQLGRAPQKNRVGRVLARLAHDPLLLGAATALLPCGALFAALAAAATLGKASSGAALMLTFSVLSGAALVTLGTLARKVSLSLPGRRALALALFAGACVMLIRPLPMLRAQGHGPHCPLHQESL